MARADPSARERGSVLVESLLVAAVMITLTGALVMIARLHSIDMAAAGAARMSAFRCALVHTNCPAPGGAMAETTAAVHFGSGLHQVGSPFFWHDLRGGPLLAGHGVVGITPVPAGLDGPAGLLGTARIGADAADLVSRVAGPDRFGLELRRGLQRHAVEVPVWQGAHAPGDPAGADLLQGMRMTLNARSAILVDAWNARAAFGPEPDTVEQRVDRGATPLMFPVRVARGAHGLTHGFMELMHALRIDADPAPLIDFRLDVDLVPPDREGP